MNNKNIFISITLVIFLLAAFFRLYGVNWDQGQHLHPDERFLTMVANGITFPKDILEYLETSLSPLNPHNRGFGFFVYGTFPVFFTKWIAQGLGKGDYGNLTLVGRRLSAFIDLGTVILVFLIAKEISLNYKAQNPKQIQSSQSQKIKRPSFGIWIFPLLSMFFYASSVLPIQLSHFYAVDTYLTFFITLSFFLLIKIINSKQISNHQILLGIALGLALASKISAILFLPIIGIGLFFWLIKNRNFFMFLASCLLFFASSYFTFRLAQPYAFQSANLFDITLNPRFIQNMKELKSMDSDKAMFPPAIQWRNTPSFIFPLKSIMLTGLGLPLGLLSVVSLIFIPFTLIKLFKIEFKRTNLFVYLKATQGYFLLMLCLLFIVIVFIYQGSLYTKNMRYFVAFYPFLSILTGFTINTFYRKMTPRITPSKSLIIILIIILATLIWPVSFLAIYQRPHSRVSASEWIYENIPSGSTLTYEIWDDPLPLHLSNKTPERYKFVEMPMYDPDVSIKWQKVVNSLEKADYIIMSSNRLWGSIPRVPDVYPLASEFYKALFDGTLGFQKVADITSLPCFPTAKLCLFSIDDSSFAEESFTVYDHPQILIYKKIHLNKDLISGWVKEAT